MRYYGREIDVVSLWSEYCDFPPNMDVNDRYLSKVVCPNPQHDTHKRHFQINQDDGLVHCFAHCGISGTFLKAIQLIEGCNERAARRIILRYASTGSKISKRRKRTAGSSPSADAIVPDLSFSTHIPQAGLEYLDGRRISGSSIASWELGWDSEELRIVIPAKDIRGETRFLIRRGIKGNQQPKYLYSEGFPKTSLLFGAGQADRTVIRSQGVILVEGSLDAIRLHQNGYTNACAILGTGISKVQSEIVAKMRPKRIYLMFDRDVAGITNIEIARKRLFKYPLFVCRYPKDKHDPAELTKEEIARSLSRAIPVHRFFSRMTRTKGGISVGQN